MKYYTIFDDFDPIAIETIRKAGEILDVHPKGVPRPNKEEMQQILEEYDGIIIGTSQKITKDMVEKIHTPKVIATASVGLDHIQIPKNREYLIQIYNTPKANAQAVAEYTFAMALSCCRRIIEGKILYLSGKDNKSLCKKPVELSGKTLGVVGAGNISRKIIEFGQFFNMEILCWTKHADKHIDLLNSGVRFTSLQELAENSDVISVNLPNIDGTKKIISSELVSYMKSEAVFISVSRLDTVDIHALINKSRECRTFYTCLDIDLDEDVRALAQGLENVLVTPHIAGGTVETRIRMFRELAQQIANRVLD